MFNDHTGYPDIKVSIKLAVLCRFFLYVQSILRPQINAGNHALYSWKLHYIHDLAQTHQQKSPTNLCLVSIIMSNLLVRRKNLYLFIRLTMTMLAFEANVKIQKDSKDQSIMDNENIQNNDEEKLLKTLTRINYDLIEKSIKINKTHQNARDFDSCFIK
jgi:hypothetical protein